MERAVAKVTFEGIDAGGDTSASEAEEGGSSGSEEERETRLMVTQRNKKGKKSGGFQSMGLSHPVFKGVMKKGYRLPTPIQRKCIPLVMDGKDVVAMARTGSGKTAAFLIPMFEHLKAHSAKVGARALILSPTRELATQTKKFTRELGKFTGLRCALVLGGDRLEDQFSAMHENPDIIIATPGRFLHLVVEMELRLSSIGYVVFDEADRLFEMGFSEQLHEIIRRLPESRQTLLLSATLPKLLVEFAKAGLKDPVLVRLDVDSKLSEQLKLSFFSTRLDDKPAVLLHLLHHVIPPTEQTVIFAPTKHHVEYLKELLQAAGVDATFIYSALDQTARKINVAKFTNKKTLVMIVTDVAARGIDIPMLDNVINYNFPAKPKLFVHRVGRVARAGRSGSAFSLVSPDELAYMLDLHLFVGRAVVPAGGREASGVFGSIPQSVIDIEDGFIQQSLSTSSDLSSLKLVADNAQKQYVRSRPTAAPESVKRVKDFPPSLPLHPIFEEQCSSHDLEKNKFLGALKSYRPSQTIFEIHSTAKASAKQVMRTKREHHGGVVSARQSTRAQQQALGTGEAGPSTQEQSREEDLRDFQTEESVSHRKRKGAKKAVKDDNYVRYAPPDMYSEKGLSLGTSFNQQAAGAALDIEGDEGTGLQRSKSRLKWDRKRKRFVGESGKEGQKKMKTESGNWISASYKSNAYKEWMERHKMEGALVGTEEESAGAAAATTWSKGRGAAIRGGRGAAIRGGRGAAIRGGSRRTAGTGRGREVAGTGKGGEAGGLRSRSEILRKRKQREFQEGRKKIKAGRKKAGPAKGGGGGRGMNKRR